MLFSYFYVLKHFVQQFVQFRFLALVFLFNIRNNENENNYYIRKPIYIHIKYVMKIFQGV